VRPLAAKGRTVSPAAPDTGSGATPPPPLVATGLVGRL